MTLFLKYNVHDEHWIATVFVCFGLFKVLFPALFISLTGEDGCCGNRCGVSQSDISMHPVRDKGLFRQSIIFKIRRSCHSQLNISVLWKPVVLMKKKTKKKKYAARCCITVAQHFGVFEIDKIMQHHQAQHSSGSPFLFLQENIYVYIQDLCSIILTGMCLNGQVFYES